MNMDRRDFVRQSTAFAAASAFLPACAKDNSGKGNANMKVKVTKDKVLVVYFSRSGNTRHAAEMFAKACGGARLVEIKAAKPYASDYGACCDEAKPECRAGTLRPIEKIAGLDVAAYDVVLVGTFNLLYSAAHAVAEGVGSAVSIDGLFPEMLAKRLAFRPFAPVFYIEAYLAWQEGVPLAPAAAELVRLVRGRVKGSADIDDFRGTTNRKETPS